MRCKDSENIFFDNIRCAKNYVFSRSLCNLLLICICISVYMS